MMLAPAIGAAAAAIAVACAAASGPKAGAGARAYQKCYSCHATEANKNDLAGPSLHGIVGRPVAAVPGVDFSPAMKRFAAGHPRWTRDLLDRFAADPESLVPGTSMVFHGMPDADERKALLDYLESFGTPRKPVRPRS
jgi:cytochrome c2